MSPTHHKSPTVIGSCMGFEREQRKVPVPARPHSTHIHGYHSIPENFSNSSESDRKTVSSLSQQQQQQDVGSPVTTSPLKMSPDTQTIDNSLTTSAPPDGGAPPNLASAPDTRETKEVTTQQSHSTSASANVGEKELKNRKGSEPPPSLQSIFSRDGMGSSRRWPNRQFNADELGNVHLKQHSFDSSYLQSLPQSPKYGRRVKSPSVSDKNAKVCAGGGGIVGIGGGGGGGDTSMLSTTGDIVEGIQEVKEVVLHQISSNPHLNSATSSPQVSHLGSPLMDGGSSSSSHHHTQQQQQLPISRAHSTQQLKLDIDNEEEVHCRSTKVTRTSSSSNADLIHHHHSSPSDRSSAPSWLKMKKDRELSQSKESLNDTLLGSGMKKTGSRESLKGKDSSGFSKVIQTPFSSKEKTKSSSVTLITPRDLNKENRERSAPSKDTQSSAEGSVENMQAPLFNQQVSPKLSNTQGFIH